MTKKASTNKYDEEKDIYFIDPRKEEVWNFYIDKKSDTYGNAYRSALKAGYSPTHAVQITSQDWWRARARKLGLLAKAEKVLHEDLEMDTVVPVIGMFGPIIDKKTKKALKKIDPDLRRIRQSSATFIASRLGKAEGYATRTELTGADGKALPTPIYGARSSGKKI